MLLLGLTGSIATGKSTVSNTLRAPPYNLPIIDADVIARKVVEPGQPAYNKIVKYFLPTTPDLLLPAEDEACGGKEMGKEGKGRPLNRPALGKRVFGMDEGRVKDRGVLNGIVHPAVRGEMRRLMVCLLNPSPHFSLFSNLCSYTTSSKATGPSSSTCPSSSNQAGNASAVQ
jgi:dephospho-CoA kinase